MSTVQTAFTRPWKIRTPILTRYLESVHVDEFFSTGKLRISSFKRFRANPDEQRGDAMEGRAHMQIASPNANHVINAMNGQEAYVLCAGTVENKAMNESFSTDDGFRILNSLAFADAISRHIPGFIAGVEGLCSYRENLLVSKHDNQPIKPPESYQNPEEWAKNYDQYVAFQSEEAFFIKHMSFSRQGEYRFIWFASGGERDFIDIVCPEATQYCQRI